MYCVISCSQLKIWKTALAQHLRLQVNLLLSWTKINHKSSKLLNCCDFEPTCHFWPQTAPKSCRCLAVPVKNAAARHPLPRSVTSWTTKTCWTYCDWNWTQTTAPSKTGRTLRVAGGWAMMNWPCWSTGPRARSHTAPPRSSCCATTKRRSPSSQNCAAFTSASTCCDCCRAGSKRTGPHAGSRLINL